MLAFLLSPLGRFGAVLLVFAAIGGFAYYEHLVISNLQSKMAIVDAKATALQTWNSDLQRDIETVQKLQQATNQSLITIQTQAAQTELELQQRQFTGSSSDIEKQVNLDFAAQLARLKALSHAQ